MSRILVIGARGMVGQKIVKRLAGHQPIGLSRTPSAAGEWISRVSDAPALTTVFATGPTSVVADLVPQVAAKGATRLVAFTSTSLATKAQSSDLDERENMRLWARDEQLVKDRCDAHGIAWTILRPTMIYAEGEDRNVSRIAGLLRRFHFFPIVGSGEGLRQPVHADDLADAAVLAASQQTCHRKTYNLPGGETLTYREMVGRICDGLGQRRIILPVPAAVFAMAMPLLHRIVPGATAAMATRMTKDMIFDPLPAKLDIGWTPRSFRPKFNDIS